MSIKGWRKLLGLVLTLGAILYDPSAAVQMVAAYGVYCAVNGVEWAAGARKPDSSMQPSAEPPSAGEIETEPEPETEGPVDSDPKPT